MQMHRRLVDVDVDDTEPGSAGPVIPTGPPRVHPRVSSVGMVAPVSTFVTSGK